MAGFKTHITTSTVCGFGYGAAGYLWLGMPPETALLAAGMCGVAGMLPDLDSGSGRPLRESCAFAAAIVPMMMVDRFSHLGLSFDAMVLCGGLLYLLIRFGAARALSRYTVHRGMFHSIPAVAIVGLVGYLVCACENADERWYKALALALGYVSHLLLDELYSIEWYGGRLRLKRSFGTAMKFWSRSMWGNISTYAKLILLGVVAFGDPILMEKLGSQIEQQRQHFNRTAGDLLDRTMR